MAKKAAQKEGDIIKMDIEKVFSLMDKAENHLLTRSR